MEQEQRNNYLTATELSGCLGHLTLQGIYKALKTHDIPTINTNTKRKLIPSVGVRKLLEERGFIYPKLCISFQIVKGGVGKTSLSFSLAVRAHHYGAKVLAIDMDQQGNLTRSFNIEARDKPVWLNIFRDNISVENALIQINEGLSFIPSNLNNSRLDVELTQASTNLRDMVRDKIAPVRSNYDLIIIDCPPAINKINTAVSCASDLIIIPINPDQYAMDGLDFTLAELERVRKEFKVDFDFRVVWNKYDARERLGAIYMHDLIKRETLVNKILPVVCRTDASVKNAIFETKTIFDLPKKSSIREDIDQFTKEVLGINTWNKY